MITTAAMGRCKPQVEPRRLRRHQEDQSPIDWDLETRPGALQQVNIPSETHACMPAQLSHPSLLRISAAPMATLPSSTKLKSCWSTLGRLFGTLQPSSRATVRLVSSISRLMCKTVAWNWEPGPTMDCWLSSTQWVSYEVIRKKKIITSYRFFFPFLLGEWSSRPQ